MKALQLTNYGEIRDSLAFNEVQKPTVQKKDVLIEVKAAAINPIDKLIIHGHLQAMLPVPFPSTLAYDVSGVVAGKGAEVSNLEIGDLVYARVPQEQMGTLAEFVAVNSEVTSKKPKNTTFEQAASLPLVGLTTIQALHQVGLKENDKVLIHAGSGGVGSFAIQYAKAKGAYVYTTTSTPNIDWVKALGADEVIDYKTADYKTIVKEADIVFDTLGQEYTTDAFEVIKQGGKVVTIIGAMDEETAKAFGIPDYQLPEQISVAMKAKEATYKYVFMHPNASQLDDIRALVEEGKIKTIIDTNYAFKDSIEALIHLETGRAKGKIVITVGS
jgi:NADPH:quinone reductase-like Zn-dependent oxidoreductase